VVGPNAVRSHRVHALSVLASQLRSPLLMLLAVTVMAVVDQIEITGSPSRQGQARRDETGGFWTRNAEQPQAGFGELVHGCLIHSFRMSLARPQQAEQAAGHGAERDLRVGDGKAPGGLPGPDVAQGAWRQPAGRVHGLQADAGQEPGDIGVRPAQPPGDHKIDQVIDLSYRAAGQGARGSGGAPMATRQDGARRSGPAARPAGWRAAAAG